MMGYLYYDGPKLSSQNIKVQVVLVVPLKAISVRFSNHNLLRPADK